MASSAHMSPLDSNSCLDSSDLFKHYGEERECSVSKWPKFWPESWNWGTGWQGLQEESKVSGPWRGTGSSSPESPQGRKEWGWEVLSSLPYLSVSLWLNRIGHWLYSLHHSNNSHPHLQTWCWRWLNSGQPQSWSLRSDWGSGPPCFSFHHSWHTSDIEGPSLVVVDTIEQCNCCAHCSKCRWAWPTLPGRQMHLRVGQHGQCTETWKHKRQEWCWMYQILDRGPRAPCLEGNVREGESWPVEKMKGRM